MKSIRAAKYIIAILIVVLNSGYCSMSPATANVVSTLPQGMVSISFDDGWLSQYENGRNILNAAHVPAIFFIISKSMLAATPPVNLITGNNVDASHWQSNNTWAQGGWIYSFSANIIANASGQLLVNYFKSDGSVVSTILTSFAASATSQTLKSYEIMAPDNVMSLQIQISLDSPGNLSVSNYFLEDGSLYMTTRQILTLQNDGHEISAHSQTHPDLTTLSLADAKTEISGSRTDLLNAGASPVGTFAYPYGAYNSNVEQIVRDTGYVGARGVEQGYNDYSSDRFALKAYEVDQASNVSEIEGRIDTALANKTWLILYFHQLDTSKSQYSASPADLQTILSYIKNHNSKIVTVGQGLNILNSPPPMSPELPGANLNSMSFATPLTILLSSVNSNSIRYTINGTIPTCTYGTLYSLPVTVKTTTTLKALGCNTAGSSGVATFNYKYTKARNGK